MSLPYDVFICYKRLSAQDFAEATKEILEECHINAFLDTKDIPTKFKGTEEWENVRNSAIVESKVFVLILTSGFEQSKEIKKELDLARKCDDKKFIYFRHKDLEPNKKIVLEDGVLEIGKHQQISFDTINDLVRKVYKNIVEKQKPQSSFPTGRWDPLPVIQFNVTQGLRRALRFPQVGWEAYNKSPYQLRARIAIHPILGGKDLHPLSDNDINGTNPYEVEPYSYIFANGCLTLPEICATRKEEELILEIQATVEDINDPEKGEHKQVPKRLKYIREANVWSYYPQRPEAKNPPLIMKRIEQKHTTGSSLLPDITEITKLKIDNNFLDQLYEEARSKAVNTYDDAKLSYFAIQAFPFEDPPSVAIYFHFYSQWADRICVFQYSDLTSNLKHYTPNKQAADFQRGAFKDLPWKTSPNFLQALSKIYDKIKPLPSVKDTKYHFFKHGSEIYWTIVFEDGVNGNEYWFEWDGHRLDESSIRKTR